MTRRVNGQQLDDALRRIVDDDGPEDLAARVRRSIISGGRVPSGAFPPGGLAPLRRELAAVAAVLLALVSGGWWWVLRLERAATPPPAVALRINQPSRYPEPSVFAHVAERQRQSARRRLHRTSQPLQRPATGGRAFLVPWSVPDTSIPPWTVYDGIGPAPLQDPVAIEVRNIEPASLRVEPIVVKELREPEPVAP